MLKKFRGYALALLVAPLLLSSCGKDDDNGTPTKPEDTTPSDYFFMATIDGQQVKLENNKNGIISGPYLGLRQEDNVIKEANLGIVYRNYPPSQANSSSVGLARKFTDAPTEQNMLDIWAQGSKTYTDSVYTNYGAIIQYSDANGKNWSTFFGTGDQTGSTFVVSEVTPFNNTLTNKLSRTVKGTFNCKLYSRDGQVKTVTNGSFRGVVQFEE